MYEGIVSLFRKIPDPRKGNGIQHDLTEVLIIAILAIICGAEWFTQMELFGREKWDWLKTFLRLDHGIPSHDTFGDVFAALDADVIAQVFAKWVETIRAKISGEVIAIDGKTVCASKSLFNIPLPVSFWQIFRQAASPPPSRHLPVCVVGASLPDEKSPQKATETEILNRL